MSIVDELRKLIKARGGSAIGVLTIADACKVLTKLETENEQANDQENNSDNQD